MPRLENTPILIKHGIAYKNVIFGPVMY